MSVVNAGPTPLQALDLIYKALGKLQAERDQHDGLSRLYLIVRQALEPPKVPKVPEGAKPDATEASAPVPEEPK